MSRDRATDLEDLVESMRVASGAVKRRLRQGVEGDRLGAPERAVLQHLTRSGPLTPTELARLEQIRPQSMGATVAKLERASLVRREPDPRDGRRHRLLVSDAGRELLQQSRAAQSRLLARALAAEFTDDEVAQLRAAVPLVQRLASAL